MKTTQKPGKTLEQLLADEYVEGTNVLLMRRRGETPPRVLDGLRPKRCSPEEGLHLFTPEELLSLRVNAINVNGRVVGYQRELDPTHARKISRWMRDGKPLPLIHVAVDGKGTMAIVDGQHRAAAAVMARIPIEGVVRRLNKDEQAELFFSQRRAKTVDQNVLTLAGSGPFERYVQSAVVEADHPWHALVSHTRHSKTKIAPYQMFQLLIRYVGNVEGQATGIKGHTIDDRWDSGLADEMAPLIACFGNKQTNVLAFRPWVLQSIGGCAMWVFRRHDRHPDDYARWQSLMPQFPFEQWLHLRTQRQMTDQLIAHWNKRLSATRRVERA